MLYLRKTPKKLVTAKNRGISYTGFSDRKLIENINGNLQYQMFCGIFLGPNSLNDFKIFSRLRTELSRKLDIKATQQILSNAWKPYLDAPNVILEDATCYETSVRFPTKVKLLWGKPEFKFVT